MLGVIELVVTIFLNLNDNRDETLNENLNEIVMNSSCVKMNSR